MKQKKEPVSKKQFNPFEPKQQAKKTAVYPKKKGSIFEKDKEDVHDEKDEFIEDHEELGETEEQIEDEMQTNVAEPDPYSEEGRHTLRDVEDEDEDWEEGWATGAAGKGQHGRYDEQKPVVKGRKVKESIKGIKKKK